jgi:malonate transporter and related proteins
MLHVLSITLPVFGLIGLGFGARVINLVSERTGGGLSEFVFTIAVPALIFKTLTAAELPQDQPWGYWISYFAGVAVVWALGMAAARRWFRHQGVAVVVAGFTTGQSNTVLVGIPLILEAYGPAGAAPLFLLIAVHLPLNLAAATLLAEGRQAHWRMILRQLVTSPILLAIAAAVVARLIDLPQPAFVQSLIAMLGAAATPCALFAMGTALHQFGLREGLGLAGVITILKLIVHPLIVLVLATQVFAMPPVWAGVAVLFAASPCGINAYLFAERYRAGVAIASTAIALSTAAAAVTTALWLAVLGIR